MKKPQAEKGTAVLEQRVKIPLTPEQKAMLDGLGRQIGVLQEKVQTVLAVLLAGQGHLEGRLAGFEGTPAAPVLIMLVDEAPPD